LIHSVLLPLLGGARVVAETPFLPAEVERMVGQTRATILVSTPAHLRLLLAHGSSLGGLRLVLSSGSLLEEETSFAASAAWGAPVVEIYGSTESGAVATRCRSVGEDAFAPLPGVQARPDRGLLWVHSSFLAASLPLDSEGGYVLADRVSFEADGRFLLQGRSDDVVKISGKRVDLADLAGRVRALPAVRDVAVLAVRSAGVRQVDIGVLVVPGDEWSEVRGQVSAALRAIVRPRWVRQAGQVPRTAAGKLDRKAILALLVGSGAEGVEPAGGFKEDL